MGLAERGASSGRNGMDGMDGSYGDYSLPGDTANLSGKKSRKRASAARFRVLS